MDNEKILREGGREIKKWQQRRLREEKQENVDKPLQRLMHIITAMQWFRNAMSAFETPREPKHNGMASQTQEKKARTRKIAIPGN